MIRLWYMRMPARNRPRWLRGIVLWLLAWGAPALLAQPAPAPLPAPLPVRAQLQAGALVVTWPAPPGQAFACVLAHSPSRLLGCATGDRYQLGPGSVDLHLRTGVGAVVEVRSYAITGAVVGQGQARVFGRVRWLPMVLEGEP